MSNPNIVVIGASAGGIEALKILVAGLPSDFECPVFVVVHIGSNPSTLPQLLSSIGPLTAVHASHGEPIEKGVIYVAPPDYHMLLLEPSKITLSHGPKENHTRPAINPLFRTAASTYGPDVTGVILSGNLDDGVLGLAEIKRKGGIAIVQDPKTAVYPSMPYYAAESVAVDYVVPVEKIPALLTSDVRKEVPVQSSMSMEKVPSELTCPECRGPLSEYRCGNLGEYRCRVGHAYSVLALAHDHHDTMERKLWEAVLVLEESAEISDRLGQQFGGAYAQVARDRREQARMLQAILNDIHPPLEDPIKKRS